MSVSHPIVLKNSVLLRGAKFSSDLYLEGGTWIQKNQPSDSFAPRQRNKIRRADFFNTIHPELAEAACRHTTT